MNVSRAHVDSCEWLDLWKVSEQRGNKHLRVEVAESIRAVSPRLFEVSWPTNISYQISGETISTDPEDVVFDGRIFRCYSRSAYLDYIASMPMIEVVTADHDGTWASMRHWAIYCLDHTVDVVSKDEPQIRLLDAPSSLTEWKQSIEKDRRSFEESLAENRDRSILSTLEERLRRRQQS
jgi:hypothetical protein